MTVRTPDPAGGREARRVHRAIRVILIVGVILSIILATLMHAWRQQAESDQFKRTTGQWLVALRLQLDATLRAATYVGGLFGASTEVTQEEFQRFASVVLGNHPEIAVIVWAPRVTGTERAAFVAEQRARGRAEFEIRERDDQRRWLIAPAREVYFPATYVAPRVLEAGQLGFSPTHPDSARADALARALARQGLAVSRPAPLLVADDPEPGFVAYYPVYRAANDPAPLGVIGVVYRPSALLARVHSEQTALAPYVFDVTGTPTRLAGSGEAYTPSALIAAGAASKWLPVGGREWQVLLLPGHRGTSPWPETLLTLLAGLAATGLAAALRARRIGAGQTEPSATAPPMATMLGEDGNLPGYQQLVEDAPDVISRETPGGRILYMSPACVRVLGWQPEEMVGRTVFDFFHPDDVYRNKRAYEQAAASPGVYPATFRVRRADGSYLWLETTSHVLPDPQTGESREVITVSRDTSGRNPEAEAVRENEAMYRRAFDCAPTAIALRDADDGRLLRVNTAFCELLGYSKSELRELSSREITHPADWRATVEAVTTAQDGQKDSFVLHKRFLRKDGSAVETRALNVLLRDDQGRPRYFVMHVYPVEDGTA